MNEYNVGDCFTIYGGCCVSYFKVRDIVLDEDGTTHKGYHVDKIVMGHFKYGYNMEVRNDIYVSADYVRNGKPSLITLKKYEEECDRVISVVEELKNR